MSRATTFTRGHLLCKQNGIFLYLREGHLDFFRQFEKMKNVLKETPHTYAYLLSQLYIILF